MTACPIFRPSDEKLYFSPKHKKHVFKFEIVINLIDSNIVWVYGGIPGSYHDLTIARQYLINWIAEDEKLLADKAYIGESKFLTPYRPYHNEEERKWNQQVAKQQSKIERINGRIKDFGLFCREYRGKDYELYSTVFIILCNIINIEKVV